MRNPLVLLLTLAILTLTGCNGSLFSSSKGSYWGDRAGGVAQGFGVYRWSNGDEYQGEWRQGKPHGQGIYVSEDKSVYFGGWSDGKPDGVGVYRSGRRGRDIRFLGLWKNGKPKLSVTATVDDDKGPALYQTDGIEIMEFRSVDIAATTGIKNTSETQFFGVKACPKGGRWHQCFGVRRMKDALYEGEFEDDQPSGIGKRISESIDGEASVGFRDVYIGNFSNGKPRGYGLSAVVASDVNSKNVLDRRIWAGEWKAGAAHGFGVATSMNGFVRSFAGKRRAIFHSAENGATYHTAENIGGFSVLSDGSMPVWNIYMYPRPSNGLIFYPDGRRYEGEVLAGRPFGKGAMVDSKKKEGFWVGEELKGDNFLVDRCIVNEESASHVSCDRFAYEIEGSKPSYFTWLYSKETVKTTFKLTGKEFRGSSTQYGGDQTLGSSKKPPLKVSYRMSPPNVVVAVHDTNDGCKSPVKYQYMGLGRVEQVVLDLEGSAPRCVQYNRLITQLRGSSTATGATWFFAPPAGWEYDGSEP